MAKIAMIGAGYVGLTTGCGLADFGHDMHVYDIDKDKMDILKKGEIPFYEKGLRDILDSNVKSGRLEFCDDLAHCLSGRDVIFFAVGTPSKDGGGADLSYLVQALEQVVDTLDGEGSRAFVIKSTIPVGATRMIHRMLSERIKERFPFDLVFNPEFLREGAAVRDFFHPDRVIVGAEKMQAREIMRDIYRPLYLIETPFLFTDWETAELVKYASNAFLALKVSFINDMARFCDRVGGDVHTVARAMGMDGRIGPKFLHPGPGYGGSCFPKDTRALLQMAASLDMRLPTIEASVETNAIQKEYIMEKLVNEMKGIKGANICILGLTFKPETDDMRESPSLEIVGRLLAMGANIRAYDPLVNGEKNPFSLNPAFTLCTSEYDAAEGSEALLLMTEWNQFRSLDPARLRIIMKGSLVFDCRNSLDGGKFVKAGMKYISVGRDSAATL